MGNKVKVLSPGTVVISIPLLDDAFVDYQSLLISSDVCLQLGLQLQTKLDMATNKDIANLYARIRAKGIKVPLTMKFGHFNYKATIEQAHYKDNANIYFISLNSYKSTKILDIMHCVV